MNSTRFLFFAGALLALVLLAPGPRSLAADDFAAVKGKVTVDGKPVPAGRITFHIGDQFAGARIKAGAYKADRIAAGDYTVTIEFPGSPPKYASEEHSELKVALRTGANEVNFDLKSR